MFHLNLLFSLAYQFTSFSLIPGDYILTLYKLIEESPIQHIGTTREDCAGFAADAYARIRGIGKICVPNLWVD